MDKSLKKSALKSHKSRNRSEFDRPLCVEKLQRKRQRQQLNSMSKEEVCQAVRQMNTYDSISEKYVEGQSEIESLRKENKKLQSIKEEYIRLLKKLKPNTKFYYIIAFTVSFNHNPTRAARSMVEGHETFHLITLLIQKTVFYTTW